MSSDSPAHHPVVRATSLRLRPENRLERLRAKLDLTRAAIQRSRYTPEQIQDVIRRAKDTVHNCVVGRLAREQGRLPMAPGAPAPAVRVRQTGHAFSSAGTPASFSSDQTT
jgi:hypothetical protein